MEQKPRAPHMELWATPPPDLDGPYPESAGLEENKTDRCVLRLEEAAEDGEVLF